MIQFAVETPCDFKDNKLPDVDVTLNVNKEENCRIDFKFYKVPKTNIGWLCFEFWQEKNYFDTGGAPKTQERKSWIGQTNFQGTFFLLQGVPIKMRLSFCSIALEVLIQQDLGCPNKNATGFLLNCSGNPHLTRRRLYSFFNLIYIASFRIQKHFWAISASRDIDFQGFKSKTGSVTFWVSVWEAITQANKHLIPVLWP